MLNFAADVRPLAYAVSLLAAFVVVCLTKNFRQIWFVFVVASAVAMALGTTRRRRGGLVVKIEGVGRLTFAPKQRRQ